MGIDYQISNPNPQIPKESQTDKTQKLKNFFNTNGQ
jgi:hypothetical protein